MVNVFLTIDVEIWCNGWDNLDKNFSEAFQQYIYGSTPHGDYGLPIQLKILQDYGLLGVFFVEPLFATRFGEEPLSEIISLITESKQEVELHLHTEWVDESLIPIIPNSSAKKQYLKLFTFDEQKKLISKGKQLLIDNGCPSVNAFRAGGFGANLSTLSALEYNGIRFDCSYDFTQAGCGLAEVSRLYQPQLMGNIYEYPLSVFLDYPGHYRHAQLCACSSAELRNMLYEAVKNDWDSVVILWHNFELLNSSQTQINNRVYKRFLELCKFLDENRDLFVCKGFSNFQPYSNQEQPKPLKSNVFRTFGRVLEQLLTEG